MDAREVDLAVVGAGVAGLTAATVAARAGLSVLVIERMGAGGQVMTVDRIENFPAYPEGVLGHELGPLLQEEAETAGAEFMLDLVQGVQAATGDGLRYVVQCESETVVARAVLIACGSQRRPLGIPGEEDMAGRGVSHCASCDGPLFRDQSVAVIGGGDSGISEAKVLAQFAGKVTVVFREAQPPAQSYLLQDLLTMPNVKLLSSTQAVEVKGDSAGVTGIRLRGPEGESQLTVRGVFPYAGLDADTGFLRGTVELDAQGQIETDARMRTSLPGVFAAGDARSGTDWRLASAAEDGRTAADAVITYLNEGDKT